MAEERICDPSVVAAECCVEMAHPEELLDSTPWFEAKDPRRCEPSQDVRAKIGIGKVTQHHQDVVHTVGVPTRPVGEAGPHRER